jgi:hypothetical protein
MCIDGIVYVIKIFFLLKLFNCSRLFPLIKFALQIHLEAT